MRDTRKSANWGFMQEVAHYLLGMVIILKGVAKIEDFHNHPVAVIFLLATGIFIIVGTAFRHRLERRFREYPALFDMMDGVALWVVAFLLRAEGSRHVWAVILFGGALYFVKGATYWRVREENREQADAWLQSTLGLMFLVAAIIMIVLGWHAQVPWLVLIGLACGIVLLVLGRRARNRISQRHSSSNEVVGFVEQLTTSRAEEPPDLATSQDDAAKAVRPPQASSDTILD